MLGQGDSKEKLDIRLYTAGTRKPYISENALDTAQPRSQCRATFWAEKALQ